MFPRSDYTHHTGFQRQWREVAGEEERGGKAEECKVGKGRVRGRVGGRVVAASVGVVGTVVCKFSKNRKYTR